MRLIFFGVFLASLVYACKKEAKETVVSPVLPEGSVVGPAIPEEGASEHERVDGFALITAQMPICQTPEKQDDPESQEAAGTQEYLKGQKGTWPPVRGQLVRVKSGRRAKSGMASYEIVDEVDLGGPVGTVYSPPLLCKRESLVFIPDLFAYTRNLNKKVPSELVDFIYGLSSEERNSLSSELDARSIKITDLKLTKSKEADVSFMQVEAKYGVSSSNEIKENGTVRFFISKKGAKFQLLEIFRGADSAGLVDIDGDGKMELIAGRTDYRSGDIWRTVYGFEPGNGFRVLMELGDESNHAYKVDPPTLVVECKRAPGAHGATHCLGLWKTDLLPNQWVHAFELKKGGLIEVPLPAKYQKRDAELRARKKE